MPNPFNKPAPKGTPMSPAQAKQAIANTQQSKPGPVKFAGAGKSPEPREINQTGKISGKDPNVFKPNKK